MPGVLRSVSVGAGMFLVNLVVQAGFVTVDWLQTYGMTYTGPIEDYGPTVAAMTVIYPVVFTGMVLVAMLVLVPTRRTALHLLVWPPNLVAYALVAAGWVLMSQLDRQVLGNLVAWSGVLVVAVTQFGVEDRGRQPHLGLTFLILGYVVGFSVPVTVFAENAEAVFSPPATAVDWIVAAVNVVLVVAAAIQLVRHRPAPPTPVPATP